MRSPESVLSHIYDVDVWFFMFLNFVEMTWTTLIHSRKGL